MFRSSSVDGIARMRKRERRLSIVLATRHPGALAALERVGNAERREALTTGGLYQALPRAHLVIVDLDALAESPGFSRERLSQVLAASGMVVTDGAAFAADPGAWLARAGAASGISAVLSPTAIAFASLSGGVGKTTLSLSLARYFRERTRLPVAVVELSSGPSAFLSLVSVNRGGHVYEVISQGKPWHSWDGITLAAMDWRFARMLDPGEVENAWRGLIAEHILTIFDAPAYHPLFPAVERLARVVVVSDVRPDALANAVFLAGKDGDILVNRGGLTARLALDRPPVAVIPHVENAASYPGSIGRRLMSVAYPGWRER